MPKQLPAIQSKLAEEGVKQAKTSAAARADKRARTPQLPIPQEEAWLLKQANKRQAVSKTASATDMSFFVGLQGNPMSANAGGRESADVKQAAETTLPKAMDEEETAIRSVSLPARHTQLLADLKADDQCLLSTIHEFSSQHTDFLSPAAVTDAISLVASLRKDAPANSNPAYVQALAAAAVLRQTGICLVHYGVSVCQSSCAGAMTTSGMVPNQCYVLDAKSCDLRI